MEKITTYNYEAFYLDYLEGNLNENEQVMLFDFLDILTKKASFHILFLDKKR